MLEVTYSLNFLEFPMAFTAYDKVHPSQYALYEAYAEMTPGGLASSAASAIVAFGQDAVVRGLDETGILSEVEGLNDALQAMVGSQSVLPTDFEVFAIWDASGEAFDVYLMDGEALFIDCVAGVAREDVFAVGKRLVLGTH